MCRPDRQLWRGRRGESVPLSQDHGQAFPPAQLRPLRLRGRGGGADTGGEAGTLQTVPQLCLRPAAGTTFQWNLRRNQFPSGAGHRLNLLQIRLVQLFFPNRIFCFTRECHNSYKAERTGITLGYRQAGFMKVLLADRLDLSLLTILSIPESRLRFVCL